MADLMSKVKQSKQTGDLKEEELEDFREELIGLVKSLEETEKKDPPPDDKIYFNENSDEYIMAEECWNDDTKKYKLAHLNNATIGYSAMYWNNLATTNYPFFSTQRNAHLFYTFVAHCNNGWPNIQWRQRYNILEGLILPVLGGMTNVEAYRLCVTVIGSLDNSPYIGITPANVTLTQLVMGMGLYLQGVLETNAPARINPTKLDMHNKKAVYDKII